jgi:flagellar protein FliO/FliZ
MQALFILFAFVAVLALIGIVLWLVHRFAGNRLGAGTQRGRMPRLAVVDAAAVDGRRRLVLIRRDNVEHLLMIGGPTDIVVEPNIVRAAAGAGREQLPYRPAGAGAEPPPRIAPLPDAFDGDDAFPHPEPQMPEPPPRPSRPAFAEELRRPVPPPMPMPMPERAERRTDPLAGFTAEPVARMEPRPEPRPEPPPRMEPRAELRPEPPQRMPRSEPMIPRAPRQMEAPKAPPMRERAAAPPPPPPPPPAPPPQANADQNLAEMAQRLEAALRRPSAPETMAPPVAPEPPPTPRAVRAAEPPAPPAGPPAKTSFENLEDEMASLLGRPKSSS